MCCDNAWYKQPRMAVSCISLQSSKRSFPKIQIFKSVHSALPLFYSSFRLSNSEIGLLWHWICSFQYLIIHFVWFRFAKYSKPNLRRRKVFCLISNGNKSSLKRWQAFASWNSRLLSLKSRKKWNSLHFCRKPISNRHFWVCMYVVAYETSS